MHKLLIVDDDEWIREGIKRNVPWEKGNIHVVGTAADGQEGWELVQQLQPDIILSDIRMPFMDGLQLAELINRQFPETKIVFLTGYDDFSYAKQALQLKASDYILKYEDNEKILHAVVQAASAIDETRRQREAAKRSKSLVLHKFLSDLVAGVGSEEMVQREAEQLGIAFYGSAFCMAVVRAEGGERFSQRNAPKDLELLLFSVKNVCNELLTEMEGERQRVYVIHYNHCINLLFDLAASEPQAQRDAVASVLKLVKETLDRSLKIRVSIGVGGIVQGYKGIPVSYREALIAAEMKDVMSTSDIVFNEQIKHSQSSHQTLMKRMLDYITSNYQKESLSLTEVAESVHITPTYVSTLFKKYKDINFVDYVIRIRLEKASELLINTDLKAYEVSEKVGYPNPQYFSVLFKKYTGLSPMEYRQQHMRT